jgi:hypothetical protein
MKPFEAINMISSLMKIILLSVGDADAEDLHESCVEYYQKKWQEISRIAAEQAAKPEIEGVSLHE